ncbi:hypothetical protein KFD70_28360 [Bacillus pfraonensis]|uniref:hypothetical protein n=1 Tax=Bacillus TaxID=1386 RepID=UPI002A52112D|nr:hypothetical protein [Bacillus pseudomycoides]
MSNLTQLIVAIVILVAQHFLSRREQVYFGAILPTFYILFLIYGNMTNLFKDGNGKELIFLGVFGTVILMGIWVSGRVHVSKKREKEMEKIEVQNM